MPVTASRPEGHATLFRLGFAAVAGVVLGLVLIIPRGYVGRADAPLRLYGEDLPAGADGMEAAVARAEQQLKGWFNLSLPDGDQRLVAHSELGVGLDRSRLRRLVRDTSKARGSVSLTGASARTEPIDLVVPVVLDRRRALAALLGLKQELDQRAIDARLALDSMAVIPERAGRRLDVDRSLAAIEQALERGAAAAPLAFQVDTPKRHARELADVRHDVLLGFFETPLDASPDASDRSFNLALAAKRLDGQVVMPGAVFDFDAAVGPRDEAQGYRIASLAAAGEALDGSGSSTSQVAGTLHAAALFAGLDVVERHPPQHRGVIDIGLDAAVAYRVANLRLKNPYDFPVVLRATLAGGSLRAEVRGAERLHTISVIRKLDRVIPFSQVESLDTTLEPGARIVAQRGVPGIDLHRYRIRRRGAHAVREVVREHHPPAPQLVRVGSRMAPSIATGSSTNAPNGLEALTTGRPPHDAASSAYPADELFVSTQRNEMDPALVEQRVAGRFAVPARSKDIGAPAWKLASPAEGEAPLRPRAGEIFTP